MGSGKIRRLLERLGAAESGVSMRIPAETRDDLAMLSKNYDTIGLYTEAFYVNSRCRQPYSSGTLKTRPPFHPTSTVLRKTVAEIRGTAGGADRLHREGLDLDHAYEAMAWLGLIASAARRSRR